MKLILLEPEVAGELGVNTKFNQNNGVEYLHYEFHGWLGDDLLESSPCFIVTSLLASSIIDAKLTGYKLEDIEVSVTEEFEEFYPNKKLPSFKRLIPFGNVTIDNDRLLSWSGDDICISNKSYLVVSEKALKVISKHSLNYCDMTILSS
jgi:hypothetical protein